jgi:UDP-glucuronate decarboxylase
VTANSSSKKILVTGGAGFLGSHLCDRLIGDGAQVICLDNLYTGSLANIEHLRGHKRFEFVEHDVIEPYSFDVDQIYNLACPASPPHYQRDPIFTMKTSVFGAINALELAKRCGARVFQASTSEVYGDPLVHPQPESYWGHVNPIGIRSCYDEGKRAAETLFFDYHRRYGVQIKVARIFNTYGPRMDPNDGRVVSNFIVQALRGEPITIYGDGSQTRSFCYVDDLIDGFVRLMNSAIPTIAPVNLGNADEFTVSELASIILETANIIGETVKEPMPSDDPTRRKPDLSRARDWLGWEPRVPLREGVRRTIEYFAVLEKTTRAIEASPTAEVSQP